MTVEKTTTKDVKIDRKHCQVCGRASGVSVYTIPGTKDEVPLCDKHFRALRGLKPVTVPKLPGRNELCLCGSSKKFKKCCLDKVMQPTRDALVELGKRKMDRIIEESNKKGSITIEEIKEAK